MHFFLSPKPSYKGICTCCFWNNTWKQDGSNKVSALHICRCGFDFHLNTRFQCCFTFSFWDQTLFNYTFNPC